MMRLEQLLVGNILNFVSDVDFFDVLQLQKDPLHLTPPPSQHCPQTTAPSPVSRARPRPRMTR